MNDMINSTYWILQIVGKNDSDSLPFKLFLAYYYLMMAKKKHFFFHTSGNNIAISLSEEAH